MVAVHLVELAPGSGISTVGPPAPGGQVDEVDPAGAEVDADPIGASVGVLGDTPSDSDPTDPDPPDPDPAGPDPPTEQPLP